MPKRRHSKPGEFLLHKPTPVGGFLESFGNLLVLVIFAALVLVGIGNVANLILIGTRLKSFIFASAYAHWLWLLAAPVTVIVLVGSMIYPGILCHDEPNGYDVVEYHLQIPREWFELGRIVPLHHNVFSYFPFNVEMHYLLAMHLRGGPWAGMYLAQLMHATFIALTIFAIYGFVRWDANRTRAVIASIALTCVPW